MHTPSGISAPVSPPSWVRLRTRLTVVLLSLSALLGHYPPAVADSTRCQTVRLADVGWSDVTATTAVMRVLLEDLGYRPQVTLLSVPVTYSAMQRGDIDLFLGNWIPAQTANLAPYLKAGSIEVITTNLSGAKYTLAVPEYAWQQGLKDFKDIARAATELNHTIYGIEPGNDGNRHILDLIKHNQFGLSEFKLVESSEQGMLAEVERAVAAHRKIVFLAWAPHPMNRHFAIHYLTGGDNSFGPDFGSAAVRTLMRPEFAKACPNLTRLASQVHFTVDDESELMADIAGSHEAPEVIARAWLAKHPEHRAAWINGVDPLNGQLPNPLMRTLAGAVWRLPKLPVGDRINALLVILKQRGAGTFKTVAAIVQWPVDTLNACIRFLPLPLLLLGIIALSYWLKRSLLLSGFVTASLLLIINLGFWSLTIDTLSLVIVATVFSVGLGVPLGVLAAQHRAVKMILNPLLDLMQTLPSFVYLIPTLVLFGLGTVPAVLATVIFAIPAPIRLTQIGIENIPPALLEAGAAFGATRWQRLWKIEMPAAAPSILQGITQCIMLALSMVVISALVGASGLGVPVVRALNTVSVGDGFEAGLAIVILAIVLDRLTRPRERH